MDNSTLFDFLRQFADVLREEESADMNPTFTSFCVHPARLPRAAEIMAALMGYIERHGTARLVRVHYVPSAATPFWALSIIMDRDAFGDPWTDAVTEGWDFDDGRYRLWVDPDRSTSDLAAEVPF